jgi:hypothetical protein
MARAPSVLPEQQNNALGPQQADEILLAVREILSPIVRLLVASGIDYTRLAAELKPIFIEQACNEIARMGNRETDSAISLLSGVHRKDVRVWRESGLGDTIAREIPMSIQVYARWIQDRTYLDRRRKPRPLPRIGPEPSFESLARSITQDIHPYTILTDLIRLGIVELGEEDGQELVIPNPQGFVPPPGSQELIQLMRANLSDHLQSVVSNLLENEKRLEQSVFAEGITVESVAKLSTLARDIWADMQREMIDQASLLYEKDKDHPEAHYRVRFGVYFWDADQSSTESENVPSKK